MESIARLGRLQSGLIDWYWAHGNQRRDRFALPMGTWLSQLYQSQELVSAIIASRRNPRPCFALWGPSQSGKSTLISSYVDAAADSLGNNSALHWPGGEPARFVVGDQEVNATVLNPFNFGSDASGCVSRFYAAEQVPDPQHPVEICLASRAEIRHALAMGYLSECRTETAGGEVFLDGERWTKKLADYTLEAQSKSNAVGVDRAAYERLHQLAELIDALILTNHYRYRNLRQHQHDLRRQMLECAALVRSCETVERFATDVLWDRREKLTGVFQRLCDLTESLRKRWQDRRVFCSLPVTALLLNIDSFAQLVAGQQPAHRQRMRERVESLTFREEPDRVVIGLNDGTRLFPDVNEFGAFQGLIWELKIPLRKETLAKNAPAFHAFLERAELLDFPGVALAHDNTKGTKLDLEAITPAEDHKLFTEVLKRGKTASVVASYARNLTIDGFSLLNKIATFPANPDQLTTGIFTWWKSFEPDFPTDGRRRKSPLPLNFILTFCAKLVAPVISSGMASGLDPVFKMIRKLDALSDPLVLSHTLATNYPNPKFQESLLAGNRVDQEKAGDRIAQDAAFLAQFVTLESQESFREMIRDGGTDYVFRVLLDQSQTVLREPLLRRREVSARETVSDLLSEAVPPVGDSNERQRKDIRIWKDKLRERLDSELSPAELANLSLHLRRLLDLDAESLDPIPEKAATRQDTERQDYIRSQFQNWVDNKKSQNPTHVGLRDVTHLINVLHCFADDADVPKLANWLRDHLGQLRSQDNTNRSRRYLAVRLANEILPLRISAHKSDVEVRTELASSGESPDSKHYARSSHYRMFLHPFLLRLDELENRLELGGTRDRPQQPGDHELVLLLEEYPEWPTAQ